MTDAHSRGNKDHLLRSRLRRKLWNYSKLAGETAWEWAKAQPRVQRQIRRVEAKVEEVKERAQVQLEWAEREFWAWVERLEAEGYIDHPQRTGPTMNICFERLGLAPNATDAEIKRAWRAKMMLYHPDRFANDPQALKRAETKAREINEAYQAIKRIRGI